MGARLESPCLKRLHWSVPNRPILMSRISTLVNIPLNLQSSIAPSGTGQKRWDAGNVTLTDYSPQKVHLRQVQVRLELHCKHHTAGLFTQPNSHAELQCCTHEIMKA